MTARSEPCRLRESKYEIDVRSHKRVAMIHMKPSPCDLLESGPDCQDQENAVCIIPGFALGTARRLEDSLETK